MFISMQKLVVIAALSALSLVGCAKQSTAPLVAKPVPNQPDPPKFNVVKPEKPSKPAPPFKLEAVDGWNLVNYVALTPDAKEPQLVAIFERDLDEEVSVRAGIIAGNLSEDDADSFLDDVRVSAHNRDDAKVLKERIFKLGELRAYEMIEGRMTGHGPQIHVTLAVSDGKVGYVVSCGGNFEDAERVLPVCAEFVEGFRVVGK